VKFPLRKYLQVQVDQIWQVVGGCAHLSEILSGEPIVNFEHPYWYLTVSFLMSHGFTTSCVMGIFWKAHMKKRDPNKLGLVFTGQDEYIMPHLHYKISCNSSSWKVNCKTSYCSWTKSLGPKQLTPNAQCQLPGQFLIQSQGKNGTMHILYPWFLGHRIVPNGWSQWS